MRRREFIAGLGGVAALPVAARAQQDERVRRVGVLIDWAKDDPEAKAGLSAFARGLSELGWTDGRNVRMDVRFGSGDIERIRALAKELIDLQPEAILASSTPATAAFHRLTRTIPIVFVTVADPVGPGFVARLPRPGGNITGFTNIESSMGGKWLELLTEIAPTQAGGHHVQSGHCPRQWLILPFRYRGGSSNPQSRGNCSARSQRLRNPSRNECPRARTTGWRHCNGGQFYDGASRSDYLAGCPKQYAGGVLGRCLR
jgi:hypothetical protein